MRSILKNKRGDIGEIMLIIVIMFTIAIIAPIGYKLISEINPKIQNTTTLPTVGKEALNTAQDRYVNIFDGAYLLILVMLIIAVVIGAAMLDVHPMFFIIAVIALAIFIIVTAILSNAFQEYSTTTAISPYISQFPIILFVMQHYATIIVGVGFMVLVTLYAKTKARV